MCFWIVSMIKHSCNVKQFILFFFEYAQNIILISHNLQFSSHLTIAIALKQDNEIYIIIFACQMNKSKTILNDNQFNN